EKSSYANPEVLPPQSQNLRWCELTTPVVSINLPTTNTPFHNGSSCEQSPANLKIKSHRFFYVPHFLLGREWLQNLEPIPHTKRPWTLLHRSKQQKRPKAVESGS